MLNNPLKISIMEFKLAFVLQMKNDNKTINKKSCILFNVLDFLEHMNYEKNMKIKTQNLKQKHTQKAYNC